MPDDDSTADPIADVFPADRIEARFVVAMSMARNDIELALRDGISAAQENRQDFTYRVRLVTSHLIEALDSLMAYTQETPDISKLMRRVAPEQRKQLRKARSVVQKVGDAAVEQIRNNTFHFPSPKANYRPSSDDQLRDVLASMSDRARRPGEQRFDRLGNPLEPVAAADQDVPDAAGLQILKDLHPEQ